jgi:hypothetical protein
MLRCLKMELLLVILLIRLPARCQSQFTLGAIEAKPGQVASGFLPVSGGTDGDTSIPVTIIHGANPGPVPTDYPRLPTPQQSSCHQQILAGDIEDETFGTVKTGRGDNAANRISAETNSRSMIAGGREKHSGRLLVAYRPLISPDLIKARAASA